MKNEPQTNAEKVRKEFNRRNRFEALWMAAIAKLRRAWRTKTCENCVHRKFCDGFFARRYKELGIEEPKAFRNLACKMHKSVDKLVKEAKNEEKETEP